MYESKSLRTQTPIPEQGNMAVRQTQVSEEFCAIRAEVSQYETLLDKLAACLQCITRDSDPEKPSVKTEIEQQIVPLAHEIRLLRYRLSTTNQALNSLISRIEV